MQAKFETKTCRETLVTPLVATFSFVMCGRPLGAAPHGQQWIARV